MLEKVEHIGIAVQDLENANQTYELLIGSEPYKVEEVESEQVKTAFFQVGETKIELLEPTSPKSAIANFINKKGEGVHHIAYAVDDIHAEIKRLQEEGFNVLNETPKAGADNKLVAFLHPKSANGVLVELCQERSSDEAFSK